MTTIPDSPPTAPRWRAYVHRPREATVHVYDEHGYAVCGERAPTWATLPADAVDVTTICRLCALAEALRTVHPSIGRDVGPQRDRLRIVPDAPVPWWRRALRWLRGGR